MARSRLISSALAFVAASVVAGVGSPAAGAHVFGHGSPNGRAVVTGTTEPGTTARFTMGSGKNVTEVTCKDTRLSGTVVNDPVEALTLVPSFSECTIPGPIKVEVRVNHCALIFQGTTVESTKGEFHGRDPIECEKGSQMEIEAAGICTVGVGAQAPTHGSTYTNLKREVTPGLFAESITLSTTAKGIVYKKIKGALCGVLPGGGSGEDGTLTALSLLDAWEDDNEEHPAGTELTTPTGEKEGPHVDLTVE
jgi:hypothetical protein